MQVRAVVNSLADHEEEVRVAGQASEWDRQHAAVEEQNQHGRADAEYDLRRIDAGEDPSRVIDPTELQSNRAYATTLREGLSHRVPAGR
jgi:hypothetical protein